MRTIMYSFEFDDKTQFIQKLEFDDQYKFISSESSPPDWTKLEFNQCENCPLKKEDCKFCPVAKNLAQVIAATKDKISHHQVNVMVTTIDRSYFKRTSMQEGLFSLFGLIMATSGCPHLDWLRSLSQFHLPFATINETLFRTLSMELVKNFLAGKKELSITPLLLRYEEIESVNQGLLTRIQSQVKGDADKNAIVALNLLAQMFNCEYNGNFSELSKIIN